MTWYAPTITVQPANEPVSLDEAKAQCRVDGTADDTALTAYIASARNYVEAYTGTALVSRTITAKCDSFADFTRVPVAPLGAVSSVAYVDSAGADQTLATSVYDVRSDGLTASLALKADQAWPTIQTGSRITVTATAGYATVPPSIKHAILLLVSLWFDNRSPLSSVTRAAPEGSIIPEVPHAVESLLANYRSFAF